MKELLDDFLFKIGEMEEEKKRIRGQAVETEEALVAAGEHTQRRFLNVPSSGGDECS